MHALNRFAIAVVSAFIFVERRCCADAVSQSRSAANWRILRWRGDHGGPGNRPYHCARA